MFKQLIKYIDMKFSRKHFENIKILQILKLKKINLIQIIQIKQGQFISCKPIKLDLIKTELSQR